MMHSFQFLLFIVILTVANCTSLAQKREDIVYGATASRIIVGMHFSLFHIAFAKYIQEYRVFQDLSVL